MTRRSSPSYGFDHLPRCFGKFCGFCGGNPGEVEPLGLDPVVLKKTPKQSELAPCVEIPLYVVTIARMASGYPYSIRTMAQRS
jgi:hypothetical protein